MTNTLDPRPDLDAARARRMRDGDVRTIWIVLGLVAVVAIIALAFVMTRNSDAAHQAALDQAASQQHALDVSTQADAVATNAAQTAGAAASAAGDAAARASRSAAVNASKNAAADDVPPASQPATADNGASTAPASQ